ncbi:hypothetical protein JAAARDRAFT_184634 [Jaapia argillacea MUCL 33604]|uniref:Carboxylic ester hydrolase n=1 Tax=Jaapia argillacea MUCL 33604 TaxID=933084 RepID=A0A067PAV0_9AGAM|nr:hypothetical protein JAAARDRAFT_184634 [Jaapia argillacea MUCL 33604]
MAKARTFSPSWAICASLVLATAQIAKAWSSYPDTDVVVVSNNDLDSTNINRASALYLKSPTFTCAEAESACAALQETLLPPPSDYTGLTNANISSALVNPIYAGCSIFTPSSASLSNASDFNQQLPALCTNSAPLTRSNSSSTDISRQISLSTPSAGILTGYRDKFSWRFLGIKYATSTRFAPPVAVNVGEEEVRNTTAYGPICAQPPDADNGHLVWTNEDCLTLNVFSPVVNTGSVLDPTAPKLPVMFFIHGGGLNTGDSGPFPYNMTTSGYVGPSISNIYDGTNLVSYGGVVLVTINYRLTAFGWFNASNAALKDALMALEWVQDNIEAFGGDKTKVLIYGESAGGTMTRYLLGTNPKYTAGLFSAAVLESDFSASNPFYSPRLALNTSLGLAKTLNCTPESTTTFDSTIASCVAALPAADVALASYNLGISWDITIDGDYVLADIASSIRDGAYGRVPTIFASNQCEYCYFLPSTINPKNTSATVFTDNLGLFINSTDAALVANQTTLYPYDTAAPPAGGVISGAFFELAQFVTDYDVHCPNTYLASLMTNTTNPGNVYKVEFTIGLGSPLTPNPATCVGQVCHADELYFAFATAETDSLYQPLTPLQLETTREIIKRWTNLARNGTPNYSGASLVWPPYTGDNEVLIGSPDSVEAYRVAQCDFIEGQLGLVFGEL